MSGSMSNMSLEISTPVGPGRCGPHPPSSALRSSELLLSSTNMTFELFQQSSSGTSLCIPSWSMYLSHFCRAASNSVGSMHVPLLQLIERDIARVAIDVHAGEHYART